MITTTAQAEIRKLQLTVTMKEDQTWVPKIPFSSPTFSPWHLSIFSLYKYFVYIWTGVGAVVAVGNHDEDHGGWQQTYLVWFLTFLLVNCVTWSNCLNALQLVFSGLKMSQPHRAMRTRGGNTYIKSLTQTWRPINSSQLTLLNDWVCEGMEDGGE